MIVAASTTLLADSRRGRRGGLLPVGAAGRGQRGEPGCQCCDGGADRDGPVDRGVAVVRADRCLRAANAPGPPWRGDFNFQPEPKRSSSSPAIARIGERVTTGSAGVAKRGTAGRDMRLDAWQWAQDNRAKDGSLPTGRDIGSQYGRHERWGRLVKRSGLAGELS
jgi:hypothetical protein